MGARQLQQEEFRKFTALENQTWRTLFQNLERCRARMAFSPFNRGLVELGIQEEQIPDLAEVNRRLLSLTGWRAVPVNGLEHGESFYPALARREFPLGNFIRESGSLGYTPAPDVFHDLYGHMPFLADPSYADFCQKFGQLALKFIGHPERLKRLERFFWFTIEFGLVYEVEGLRIFGAGILSSRDESAYSLSEKPMVLPFDVAIICREEYRLDQIQPKLFVLDSPEQLYSSLVQVEKVVAS